MKAATCLWKVSWTPKDFFFKSGGPNFYTYRIKITLTDIKALLTLTVALVKANGLDLPSVPFPPSHSGVGRVLAAAAVSESKVALN